MAEQSKGITMLTFKVVLERVGYQKSTVFKWMNPDSPDYDPSFPVPVKSRSGSNRWVDSEIQTWLESRVSANRPAVERARQVDRSDDTQIANTHRNLGIVAIEVQAAEKKRRLPSRAPIKPDAALPINQPDCINEIQITEAGAGGKQISDTPHILVNDLIDAEKIKKTCIPRNGTVYSQDDELTRSHANKSNEVPISGTPRIFEKVFNEAEALESTRIATVRKLLEEKARHGSRIFYEELMAPIRLWADLPADRLVIEKILVDITKTSHAENKGLLGVLVHEKRAGKSRPSDAFFDLALSLGYTYTDPNNFVENQIVRLFEAYEDPAKKKKGKLMWMECRNQIFLVRRERRDP